MIGVCTSVVAPVVLPCGLQTLPNPHNRLFSWHFFLYSVYWPLFLVFVLMLNEINQGFVLFFFKQGVILNLYEKNVKRSWPWSWQWIFFFIVRQLIIVCPSISEGPLYTSWLVVHHSSSLFLVFFSIYPSVCLSVCLSDFTSVFPFILNYSFLLATIWMSLFHCVRHLLSCHWIHVKFIVLSVLCCMWFPHSFSVIAQLVCLCLFVCCVLCFYLFVCVCVFSPCLHHSCQNPQPHCAVHFS